MSDAPITPTLLAARERLLEGIVATWPSSRQKVAKPKRNLVVIDLDAERAKVEELRLKWQREVVKKEAMLAAGTTPGHNYWETEHRARVQYILAAGLLDQLEA